VARRASEHFGRYAGDYRRYRPDYPDSLFDRIASLSPGRSRALDCATGSGQAAVGLSTRFDDVVGVDVSTAQLREGERRPGVVYVTAACESLPLPRESVDAVTVAQALHWLEFDSFFDEVRRVGKRGGLFATWVYATIRIGPRVDRVVERLYRDILGSCWLPERRYVETAYASIPIPLRSVSLEDLVIEKRWSLADLCGYLATWSAGRIYADRHGVDPLSLVREELSAAWLSDANGSRETTVRWPVTLRTFRI